MRYPFPLVIFDLDGTLVDSLSDISEALNLTLADLALPQFDEATVRGWVGEGVRSLVASALQASRSSLALDEVMPGFMRHYGECLLHHPRLYPGVAEALDGLQARAVTLAVCTNKPARFVQPLLAHLGIAGHFSAVLGGDSLPQRKPDPTPLLHLCAQFGQSAQQCLMVGDSAVDAAAANAAHVPLALVRYGYLRGLDPRHSGARWVMDDMRELLAIDTAG
ncbi:MAG TPA: phosphoglycolate phosphatase [Stenotrophomonas sp.]|nr:phosphoglycolate phosphatase [Stenotrophomonas sp.]